MEKCMADYESTDYKNEGGQPKRQYEQKNMQSNFCKNLDEGEHEWLRFNIDHKKTSAVINKQEQMIRDQGVVEELTAVCYE